MKIKSKSLMYIFILQSVCVIVAIAVLLIIRLFSNELFGKIKEKHNDYFNEETVIEEESTAKAVSNSFIVPIKNGIVTSNFGIRNDPFTSKLSGHNGTDIAADYGTPIYSAYSGHVSFVGYEENGYGNYLKIDHGNGLCTLYGHCSKILIKEGQYVSAGQTVALVGSTGRSTGNHLHFEVIVDGNPLNSEWYVEF